MKVTLLHSTPDPLREMYARTRGTTTSKGFAAVYAEPHRFFPKDVRAIRATAVASEAQGQTLGLNIERADRNEMARLVLEALAAGHTSISRGTHFTFAIECSRSMGRQMLRHVVGVAWEEMSQRYVKLLNGAYETRLREAIELYGKAVAQDPQLGAARRAAPALRAVLAEVFEIPPHYADESADAFKTVLFSRWALVRQREIRQYLDEIAEGIPVEDARENLPNCMLTQMDATFSFEALQNFLAKRLCDRAQPPVRTMARQMRKLVLSEIPWAAPALGIQCSLKGYCPETHPKGCPLHFNNGGKFLSADQLKEAAAAYRANAAPIIPIIPGAPNAE